MYDVIIIGAGVSGAAAARELSRYNAKICVIEKEEDVCCGTSKANSAIVHAGYDAKEGSLMAKLNVRGNAMMEQLHALTGMDIPKNLRGLEGRPVLHTDVIDKDAMLDYVLSDVLK